MRVRIVTDSSSDIPEEIARELNITVVPLYISFGSENLRDGIDIRPEEFYKRLVADTVHPTTAAASPGDFAATYERIGDGADGIISIHLSRKASATYDAAVRGKEMVYGKKYRVEVVDSKLVTIALGLVVIAAARAAKDGKDFEAILDIVNRVILHIRVYGLLDSLKYVVKGGRLGKVGLLIGSMLPVKPLLTMKDGLVTPMGVVRTRSKGMERLFEIIKATAKVKNIGIAHSTNDEEIKSFTDKLRSLLPDLKPVITALGPALGVHGGPGTILVAVEREHTV